MNILWVLSLVCLSSMTVYSQSDLFQVPKREVRRKYCGPLLSNALSLVCSGIYNSPYSKKDIAYNEGQNDDYLYDMLSEEPRWPFLPRQTANSMLARGEYYGRYRRGVHDECCLKACTEKELMAYCGPQ